jgi:hypothetical protein
VPPVLLSLELLQPTAPGFTRCGLSVCSNTVFGGELRRRRGRLNSAAVDAFVLVLLGGVVAVAAAVWLLGRYYPGSGTEQLGLRSGREITETREALEAEDLEQMLAVHNARRRARGESELTVAELERQVSVDSSPRSREG